jgi:NAD(P)-dependent dehydrogenase (short-subunit alcohol dehydrogenase family)
MIKARPGLFSLENRVAVVIGSGSGIGAAVAAGLAASGAVVECLDVDHASADATASHIRGTGGDATPGRMDITAGSEVGDGFRDIRGRRGRLDVVVCTPSINVRKPILNYSDEEFDRVWTVNVKGSFHVVRAAGAIMTADGRGSIVLFSSIRSQVVEPGQAVYAATKAAIVQLVRTAAAEFGPSGVRVNAVAPGVVETPLTAPIKANPDWYGAYAKKTVFNRWARPEEMVGPTLFLASDASSYVTGTVLFADGGWTAADGRFHPPGM